VRDVDGELHVIDHGSIRLSDVRDGLSSTTFVAERAVVVDRMPDPARDPYVPLGSYFAGNFGDALSTAFYPPTMHLRVSAAAGRAHMHAMSSRHPGGLHVLLGDGSVRFVSDSVETRPFDPTTGIPSGARPTRGGWWSGTPAPGVRQKLATRAGGEVLDAGAY
jgi:prepilin-type processing-associated H-X9-DG protein